MIKAEQNIWVRRIFEPYEKWILRKSFSHIYICGDIPVISESKALLLVPNHISWWDGFIADHLNRIFIKKTIYLMMLEEQLRRYKFFKKLGAFSVNPNNINDAANSLRYARALLNDSKNMVVIYPQGILQSQFIPHVKAKEGIFALAGMSGNQFQILPIAALVNPYDEKKPEIIIRLGKLNINTDFVQKSAVFEDEFNSLISEAKKDALKRTFVQDIIQLG
ncbi:MAG: lysophospholipid acyltransferase family protein [Pseudomonadota bacterium]